MSNVRANLLAGIVSSTENAKPRVNLLAGIVSATDIPALRMNLFSAIVSVTAGRPVAHSPVNTKSRGPVNIFKDMPVSGKGK